MSRNASEYQVEKRISLFSPVAVLSLICIILSIIPIIVAKFLSPFEQGFACSDASLKKAYHGSTIPFAAAFFFFTIFAFLCVLICEFLLQRDESRSSMAWRLKPRVVITLRNWAFPPLITAFCYEALLFTFGSGLTMSITDVLKIMAGRLRPHFWAVCDPLFVLGSCPNGDYARPSDYECQGSTEDGGARKLRQMRLSFPSGHTSFVFFAAFFTIFYVQKACSNRSLTFIRAFIQAFIFVCACMVGVSRIQDFKHHWSDVFAGAAIGFFVALFITAGQQCFIGPLRSEKDYRIAEDRERDDTEQGKNERNDGMQMRSTTVDYH